MDNKVFLACYHGRADKVGHRLCDAITRFITKGKYSHCEIAIKVQGNIYHCYSSSIRDGGVRTKTMLLDDKWDLIALDGLTAADIEEYYWQTKGAKYDLLGALGVVFGLRQHASKYFCSEWCYNAIFGSNQGFRFSPNQLAEIVRHLSILDN
ncbi:enoyl-CoA hydratase [Moraxella catarrhalis]|uniref:hypothetical protein n=1 Tax=Moraxella catarrhalis TaxID=480 RepID=UPI0007E36829|nr:hypothetical protein [Moraxella catarrhalis]MPY07421.1 enoyl-CoA hydratase [Moraxella catarrhalis]OAV09530.1 putative cytoplasmic protein [Moraxella catarrhalis]OAV14936.1 putative cytoplasmic protein [Moraxella catarrhalis]OAV23701.1 putative cytoplasmic protein [Moraxella catarrhalis]OAV31709.1 putative cytoplasmic protein [Moraxella catarrhalis]